MRRDLILATALCSTACFAEPPSSSSSGDGSTSGSTTNGSAGDTEEDDDDDDAASSGGGSSSSGGFGTATFGSSSSTGEGFEDTDDPEPEVVFDLYEDCTLGVWETFDVDALVETTCENNPADAHAQGGGWRYEMFDSPAFGMVEKALVIRPQPGTGGLTGAAFNSGRLGFAMPGARLKLRYEFVNTQSPVGDAGTMTFQIRRLPPDSMPGGGATLFEELMLEGASGVVDVSIDIAGPLDELVFIVLGDTPVTDQGVALYEPEIVFEP